MSSMRLNTCLGTFFLGPSNPFKDPGIVADSLTGVRSELRKCLYVVNKSGIHKDFEVLPPVEIQKIQIR
jgi:hypothetical protein